MVRTLDMKWNVNCEKNWDGSWDESISKKRYFVSFIGPSNPRPEVTKHL